MRAVKCYETFSIVCSNGHQILTLVISHCSLAEDMQRISKKLTILYVRHEVSSHGKPKIFLLCGAGINIAIAIAVVIS